MSSSMPIQVPSARTEEDFRTTLMPHAQLSLATSIIAMGQATQPNTAEFAGFEFEEAAAVITVLKNAGTHVPEPDHKAQTTLEKIKNAAKGNDFDQAYITAQLENHEFLRDLAASYLNNTADSTSETEKPVRQLATLALSTFKEHVAMCKRISGELRRNV